MAGEKSGCKGAASELITLVIASCRRIDPEAVDRLFKEETDAICGAAGAVFDLLFQSGPGEKTSLARQCLLRLAKLWVSCSIGKHPLKARRVGIASAAVRGAPAGALLPKTGAPWPRQAPLPVLQPAPAEHATTEQASRATPVCSSYVLGSRLARVNVCWHGARSTGGFSEVPCPRCNRTAGRSPPMTPAYRSPRPASRRHQPGRRPGRRHRVNWRRTSPRAPSISCPHQRKCEGGVPRHGAQRGRSLPTVMPGQNVWRRRDRSIRTTPARRNTGGRRLETLQSAAVPGLGTALGASGARRRVT